MHFRLNQLSLAWHTKLFMETRLLILLIICPSLYSTSHTLLWPQCWFLEHLFPTRVLSFLLLLSQGLHPALSFSSFLPLSAFSDLSKIGLLPYSAISEHPVFPGNISNVSIRFLFGFDSCIWPILLSDTYALQERDFVWRTSVHPVPIVLGP